MFDEIYKSAVRVFVCWQFDLFETTVLVLELIFIWIFD